MPAAFSTETTLALACHPDAPDAAVQGIAVSLTRAPDGSLALRYRLAGTLAALRIPDAATPLPPERLWAHTCFELFVAEPGTDAYREFNFSPGGQWMRFDFCAYRQRVASPAGPAPQIVVQAGDGVLELRALLPAQLLPPGDLILGLTAVVENKDGAHRYWALRHPAGQPDFHHRDGFAFALKVSTP